jgi:thiamine phosphate phosphatase / amino-HMP aminohydrolase
MFTRLREAGSGPILYVGDSSTDFDCLIVAELGICVRDEPIAMHQMELKETLERVGIEVVRLGAEARARGNETKKIICWVKDLRGIEFDDIIEG